MKKALVYIAILTGLVLSCKNQPSSVVLQGSNDVAHQMDTANYTTIQWIDSLKDFGTVTQGEKVKVVFQFLNSGNKPLYLFSVKPGCGCTLADYTKSAVLPGDKGQVVAEYDSNHGSPNQPVRKTISVTCNARNKSQSTLVFTGKVKAKS